MDPKNEKDRLDERERAQEAHEDPPNPEDRLDERVAQLPPPTDRLQDEEDDGPAAA